MPSRVLDRSSTRVPGSNVGAGRKPQSPQAQRRFMRQSLIRAPQLPSTPTQASAPALALIAPGVAQDVWRISSPSGARGIGVCHLRLLGHAPHTK
ncbi:hypothetical protein NDU88_006595 [Pleurodeles waltl]|uniref:Uncharacterized protein n=1 Tax=Pleurodeles waltl TaxID=8319 RepID=A0AAV7U0L5_PLEWA|nr:hypothetical protein NDU88_006595 [Pleurodeles waltl]